MIEHVGALADQLGLVAADALDHGLDRFLAQLLGDLLAAAAEQAGGIGGVGIGALAAVDHGVQPVEHVLVGDAVLWRFFSAFFLAFFFFAIEGYSATPLAWALRTILRQNHAGCEI